MLYYSYLIFAVLCFIGEIFTMDFSLSCFGMGLLGAAVAAWLGWSLTWQAVVFMVVSGALFFSIRPLAHKYFYNSSKHIKTNVDALIGRHVKVLSAPDLQSHIGRVETDGDNWRAYFNDLAKEGDKVCVEKIDGNTLFVTAISKQEDSKTC